VPAPFDKPWHGLATAGNMSLSFVNTLDWRLRERPLELLTSYEELLRWAWSAEAIGGSDARSLRLWATAHPRVAARCLEDARALREAMAEIFSALVNGLSPPAAAGARLDAACCAARAAQALSPAGGRWSFGWRSRDPAPERPLLATALDAASLLTSPDIEKVKQCGDAACGWFFLDVSRNRSRRWCSMEGCGNRNKARSFYERSVKKRTKR